MALRERMAMSAAPIFLRIGLGVTFLWAGLGKLVDASYEVKGLDAAILANMGVNIGAGVAPAPKVIETPPASAPPERKADPKPDASTPEKPAEKAPEKPAPKSLSGSKNTPPPALMQTAGAPGHDGGTAPAYTMADFPEPRKVKNVYAVALMLWKGANPGPDATGTAQMRIVPRWAGEQSWPLRLAWAATIAETLGGTMLLVGLFTRISALTLAFTIGVASWMSVIGPAVQSGQTTLGFLPQYGRFSLEWMMPLWQFSLFTGALGLFFAGPGAASLDSVIFARPPAPTPQPKPKPAE